MLGTGSYLCKAMVCQPQLTVTQPPISLASQMGKNRLRKLSGKDKDREITYQSSSQANHTYLRENANILLPIKIYLGSEEQRQFWSNISPPCFPMFNFIPDSSNPTPRQHSEWGDTYCQSITFLLCNFSLFTHFLCSIMGSLSPSDNIQLLQCRLSPQVTVASGNVHLLHRGVLQSVDIVSSAMEHLLVLLLLCCLCCFSFCLLALPM